MSQPQIGTRFCRFELNGDGGYMCSRDEYCCQIGCCLSPTFQFYQLWYYWFMVFFIFLVCSGGQWWYKYMMHGRCTSAMPPPPRRTSYPRQCRVAYTPARDTVVLHHLWKPSYTGMSGAPPAYTPNVPPESSFGGAIPKQSPYMQLYGPPPSYESVIGSGPVPVHHLPGSPYDQSCSGSAQIPLDGPSHDLQPNFPLPQQQHYKSTRPPQFSEGTYSLAGSGIIGQMPAQNLHSLAGTQQQHFKPNRTHHLSDIQYSLASAGSSSQMPAESSSQEAQYSLASAQSYVKPTRAQHHRHLSLGAHLESGNGASCLAKAEHSSMENQRPTTSSGHLHHKPTHHRPLSMGANNTPLELSNYSSLGGSNPDVQLPLSLANTPGHFKISHHHRQASSGHTLPGSGHHHTRQSSAHGHHYHPHHVHHRQASHPVPLDSGGMQVVSLGVLPPEQGEGAKFPPPPPLEDSRIERIDKTPDSDCAPSSLPLPNIHSKADPPVNISQVPPIESNTPPSSAPQHT